MTQTRYTVTSAEDMARLLIVDDNETIRFLMRFYLERGGHIVCGEAKDGLEGIEMAKQTLPDVILLDLTMPELSGIETAAVLKQRLPHIPIILFTLHEDGINQELATIMGVDMVVGKMEGVPRLAESVKELLERRAPTSAAQRVETSKNDTAAAPTQATLGKRQDVH
jgi:CheY-like chemotaxis protein